MGQPVRLLEEQECDTLFLDCEPGAIPPFGELYHLPVYLHEHWPKTQRLFLAWEHIPRVSAWEMRTSFDS